MKINKLFTRSKQTSFFLVFALLFLIISSTNYFADATESDVTPRIIVVEQLNHHLVITLFGDPLQVINQYDDYNELGATCTDVYHDEDTQEIEIDSTSVDTEIVGFYEVTYDCVDYFGNAAITTIRIVQIMGVTAPEDPPIKKSGGSDNKHKLRPTFGLSHTTHIPLVDGGFGFNNMSFDITNNRYASFDVQNVTLGEINSFSAKVYAEKKLMIQEFLFGIPEIGESHKAELGIEVWYNHTGGIIDTKIIQKTDIIDPDTLFVVHEKVKCQESDNIEKCDLTLISIKFLEPLKDNIMAIKAIDFKQRSQVTFLSEGFNISGDSLNPLIEKYIGGTENHEGLIKITQAAKYSNYWFAEDGRLFESNAAGSLSQINKSFERYVDNAEPKDRRHSEFSTSIKEQQIIAQIVLEKICPQCK